MRTSKLKFLICVAFYSLMLLSDKHLAFAGSINAQPEPVIQFTTYKFDDVKDPNLSPAGGTPTLTDYDRRYILNRLEGNFPLLLGRSVEEVKNYILWGSSDPAIFDQSMLNGMDYQFGEIERERNIAVLKVWYLLSPDRLKNLGVYIFEDNKSVGCVFFDPIQINLPEENAYYKAITGLPELKKKISIETPGIGKSDLSFFQAKRQDNYIEVYGIANKTDPKNDLQKRLLTRPFIVMQAFYPKNMEKCVDDIVSDRIIRANPD